MQREASDVRYFVVFSEPFSVTFLTAFPIADPSFGISFSTFFAALFSPRPRSSTVRLLLCSALDLSAALDETTVCTSPTANKTTTMTILCMRHLAIGETISRRCAKGGVLSRGERGIL